MGDDGATSDACTFQDGVDYVGDDVGSQEGMNPNTCCEMCAGRNRQQEGACQVAVLSSRYDNPPQACWLKRSVTKSMSKPGVISCIPSENLGTLPSGPTGPQEFPKPQASLPSRFLDAGPQGASLGAQRLGERGKCDYQEGIDYVGDDDGNPIERMSRASCCDICVMRNRRRPGSCKVAVLSSPQDSPPLTCWIKTSRVRSVRKVGVVSCIPQG